MRYFYGAGHEQFKPSALRHRQLAEEAGFDGVACSDYFQPWWDGGDSGLAWFRLATTAQPTSRCLIGPAVTPALERYHPARIREIEKLFAATVGVMNRSGHDPEGMTRVHGETVLAALRG